MRILGFILLGIVGIIALIYLGYKLFYFVVGNWVVFFIIGCVFLGVVGFLLIMDINVVQMFNDLIGYWIKGNVNV